MSHRHVSRTRTRAAPSRAAVPQGGFMEDVWHMSSRKPAPKKVDWVELLRQRSGARA